MIEFKDSFGIERAIDINVSFCGKYINITTYTPLKTNSGNTFQMPLNAFDNFVKHINTLNENLLNLHKHA